MRTPWSAWSDMKKWMREQLDDYLRLQKWYLKITFLYIFPVAALVSIINLLIIRYLEHLGVVVYSVWRGW